MTEKIVWHCKYFTDLTVSEIYDILQLRSVVFVVEQQCLFLDLDGIDKLSYHLFCYQEDKLTACCRMIAPDITFPGQSFDWTCG